MQQTRREIVDELLDYVGEQGDVNARNTANLVINRVLMKLWLKHPWTAFRSAVSYQFSSVVNQRGYSLPVYFGRAQQDAVAQNLTTGRKVVWRDQMDILDADPSAGTSLETAGEPERYFVSGVAGVTTQPASTGEALEVVSTAAADTAVTVVVEGRDASGVELRAQVTLNGTTAVAVGTWSYVEEFSKALPAGTDPATVGTSSVGSVTLRKVAGAVALETLLPAESARQHTQIVLYRMPSQVWSFAIPYLRAPRKLMYDGDALPQFWGPAVFEEMAIEWKVNRGEIESAEGIPRPAFLDLLCEDNRSRVHPRTKPYHRP